MDKETKKLETRYNSADSALWWIIVVDPDGSNSFAQIFQGAIISSQKMTSETFQKSFGLNHDPFFFSEKKTLMSQPTHNPKP